MIFSVTGSLRSSRQSPESRWRRFANGGVPLLLVALCVLLRPLAAASPPDPTWIAGLYDDADFDNVVTAIGGMVCISDAPGTAAIRPHWHLGALVFSGGVDAASATLLSISTRSPPRL